MVHLEGALCYEAWEKALPLDDPKRDFLLTGIKDGFKITTTPHLGPNVWQNNYKSATCPDNFNLVEAQIYEELANGRYRIAKNRPTIISALGAIPKSTPGQIRLIHDCSRPHGFSLNSLAENEKFSFQSIQDAVDMVTPGCYLAKIDLSAAYRSVKIHPSEHTLAGLSWTFTGDNHPTIIYDTRLMFGARQAPQIFNELSQAVKRIMNFRGLQRIVCYLDDFLILGDSRQIVSKWTLELITLLRYLGFSINYNKVMGPAQSLEFLGVEFDTTACVLRLSKLKMSRLLSDVKQLMSKSSASKRDLQSLAGKLNWASQVIHGGRPHLRRILDRINTLKGPSHRTRITSDMKKDLSWWIDFAALFNGALPMIDSRPMSPVCLDACNLSGGGFYNGSWFNIPWSTWPGASEKHINYKEVLSLEPAACLWAPFWANRQVIVYCDNVAAVYLINKGTAKDSFVMDSLRRVFWLSAFWNFKLRAIYYPGHRNILADAASRIHEPWALASLTKALDNTFIY